MKVLCLLLVLAGLPGSPPARKAPSATTNLSAEDARTQAEAYVNAIDTPISETQWKALGEAGAAALSRLAQDPSVLPTRRAQAVAGLGYTGSASSLEVVQKLAGDATAPRTVRLQAIRSLGVLLSASPLIESLQPFLEADPDARVRAAAAEVLAKKAPSEGCKRVKRQVEKESAKGAFARALRACGGA